MIDGAGIFDAQGARAVPWEKHRGRWTEIQHSRSDPNIHKLKVFRLEAIRAGFKKAWNDKNYAAILDVARKIPETVIQEDQQLLMWYDFSQTRVGEE